MSVLGWFHFGMFGLGMPNRSTYADSEVSLQTHPAANAGFHTCGFDRKLRGNEGVSPVGGTLKRFALFHWLPLESNGSPRGYPEIERQP